jgi:hypothetical protein
MLEQQAGLSPELSNCSGCAHVEYIYFTGIVCHAGNPKVNSAGKCLDFQQDLRGTNDDVAIITAPA